MKTLLLILIALSITATTQTYAFYNMGDAAADFSEGYQSGQMSKANRRLLKKRSKNGDWSQGVFLIDKRAGPAYVYRTTKNGPERSRFPSRRN